MSEDLPELATNDAWRAAMKAARKAAKLTQAELGDRVGTSQAVIGAIEVGPTTGVASSKFVMPICRELKIQPPFHSASDEQRIWQALGIELHNLSPSQYRTAVELVKGILSTLKTRSETEQTGAASTSKESATKPTTPPRRTKR